MICCAWTAWSQRASSPRCSIFSSWLIPSHLALGPSPVEYIDSHTKHWHGKTLFCSKSKETRADRKGEDLEIGEDFPIKETSGVETKDWKPQKLDISSSTCHQLTKHERRSSKIHGVVKGRKEDMVEKEEWGMKKKKKVGEISRTMKIRSVLKQNNFSQLLTNLSSHLDAWMKQRLITSSVTSAPTSIPQWGG